MINFMNEFALFSHVTCQSTSGEILREREGHIGDSGTVLYIGTY